MKKILLLKGQSGYNVLRVAIDHIALSIKEQGYDCFVLDLYDSKSEAELFNCIMNEEVEFIFTFNAILLEVQNVCNLLQKFDIPVITYLVDNPIYHLQRFYSTYNNLNVATFDRENAGLLRTYFPFLKQNKFIPFFGFSATSKQIYQDRSIDVLFVGTYVDPKSLKEQIDKLDGIFKTVANNVIDILLKNTELSLDKALRRYLLQINFEIEQDEFLDLMSQIKLVDQYVRNYFRDKVIRKVLDAGITLHTYGSGWEILKTEYPSNLITLSGEEANLMTGIELMGDAKIVLSVMPWFKDCIQDRIISTMLNGAISLTDSSKYMEENLVDGEEIVFYSLDQLELLPETINQLLLDDGKAAQIASNGEEKARTNYSLSIFGENIVEFAYEAVDRKKKESIEKGEKENQLILDSSSFNDLERFFFLEKHNIMTKWLHYFEIYDRHFQKFRNKPVTVLEIGVFGGASMQMWKEYFGPQARIIGIDIDPDCKAYEDEQIEIFIGSQEDRDFLRRVKEEVGSVDILIDDGGHTMIQQIITFEEMYDWIDKNGVYLCEDLHTSYWKRYGGGFRNKDTFIEYSKNFIDKINAWHSQTAELNIDSFTKSTHSLHYYDSILAIEKREVDPPLSVKKIIE